MFKLLVAYDGSECADAAVADLARAGLPKETEAKILAVADVWSAPEGGPVNPYLPPEAAFAYQNALEYGKRTKEESRRLTEKAAGTLRGLFPGWKITAEAPVGPPARTLVKRADAWDADLVVVGCHGRSLLGRMFFGSVSQTVVSHVSCSVRIGRCHGAGGKNSAPPRLVVAVDGSFSSNLAVRTVAARDWPAGTAVHLLTVADTRIVTSIAFNAGVKPWIHEKDRDPLAWVGRMMDEFKGELDRTGLKVTSLIREGEPKTVLLEEAAKWKADCIFMGARGLGMGERLILGSVSGAVAARAHCSVEIIQSRAKERSDASQSV